jgi:hypothetical protein
MKKPVVQVTGHPILPQMVRVGRKVHESGRAIAVLLEEVVIVGDTDVVRVVGELPAWSVDKQRAETDLATFVLAQAFTAYSTLIPLLTSRQRVVQSK